MMRLVDTMMAILTIRTDQMQDLEGRRGALVYYTLWFITFERHLRQFLNTFRGFKWEIQVQS